MLRAALQNEVARGEILDVLGKGLASVEHLSQRCGIDTR
jgi:hypothetical protein